MKITLNLPAELLHRTTAEAARRSMSLSELVAEALEREVGCRPAPAWRRLAGKAKKLDTRPVKRAIAAAFSRGAKMHGP